MSEDDLGASLLVQAGTDSICAGTNCATDEDYEAWVEIPGVFQKYGSDCDGLAPAAGDHM